MWHRRNMLTGTAAGLALLPTFGLRAQGLSPKSEAPDISVYVKTAMVEDASLSPDGRHVALITNKDNATYALVRSLAGGKDVAFDLEQRKVRSVFWGSNEHIVVSNSRFTQDLNKDISSRGEVYSRRIFNIKTGADKIAFEKAGKNSKELSATIGNFIFRYYSNGKFYLKTDNV